MQRCRLERDSSRQNQGAQNDKGLWCCVSGMQVKKDKGIDPSTCATLRSAQDDSAYISCILACQKQALRMTADAEALVTRYLLSTCFKMDLALRNQGRSRRLRYPGMAAFLPKIFWAQTLASAGRPCLRRKSA
jgi:hypothetical protein